MNYRLIFTESYTRRAIRFLRRHPEIRNQYGKILELMELNPFHPSLRLHRLQGRHKDLHSVSINISYRMTILFILHDRTIIPVDVGPHNVVYG